MLIINLKFSLKGSFWVDHTNVLIHEYAPVLQLGLASINNLSSEHDISKATCRVRCCDVNTEYTCCPPTDDKEDMSHDTRLTATLHVNMPTVRTCACRDMGSMSVCVCPAFTVLGGKKTKKEGHHKDFLYIWTFIITRKGHRSVLPPPSCGGQL